MEYASEMNGMEIAIIGMAFRFPGDLSQPDQFWKIVADYRVNIFYTAPTAIRALMRLGEEWPNKHDIFDIWGVNSGSQEIHGHGYARFAGANNGKIAFQLMAVTLSPGDTTSIVVVAGKTPQFSGHEGSMGIVYAKNDTLFIPQIIFS